MNDLPATPPAADSTDAELLHFIAVQVADIRFLAYWLVVLVGLVLFVLIVGIGRRL